MIHKILLMMFTLLLIASPVLSQETTPTPLEEVITVPDVVVLPDQTNTILLVLIVVIAVIVAVFLPIIIAIFVLAYNRVPPWAQQTLLHQRTLIEGAIDKGTQGLVDLSKVIPGSLDNIAADFIREQVKNAIRDTFDKLEAEGKVMIVPKQEGL